MTKTEINVFIYLVGDYAAQTEWGKKHWLDFDVWRTVRNGAIGAFFGPLVSVYYDFSDLILPPEVLSNAPKKIFMDQTVYLATKCSVYIMLVGMLAGRSFNDCFDDVKSRIWIEQGLAILAFCSLHHLQRDPPSTADIVGELCGHRVVIDPCIYNCGREKYG